MLDLAAHRKETTVAFLAAIILALQALLASLSLPAASQGAALDVFGNPLCVASLEQGAVPVGGPSEQATCCTLGCWMAATTLQAPGPPVAVSRLDTRRGLVIHAILAHGRLEHGSARPRAPPPMT